MENERKEGGTLKTIEIVLMAAAITLLWKLFEAVMSYKDKTFSLGQLEEYSRTPVKFHGQYRWQHLPMSFLNNWAASWGDLIIFPIINALVVSSAWSLPGWQWDGIAFIVIFVFFIAGITVSVIFHRAWWGHDENLGHIFIGWNIGVSASDRVDSPPGRNNFYDDMTQAGWVHFWFMSAQVAIVLSWIFMPMPPMAIFYIALLLISFICLQQMQAVFVQKGTGSQATAITVAEVLVVILIAAIKLR